MGKKKADVMAEQREIFLKGSQERNFDTKKANQLFDLMAYFAGYGFNKSHSAAYAMIAYQTAYLKANYMAEFMACLISLESSNADKMSFYLQEAKDLGLTILPPDINRSEIMFNVVYERSNPSTGSGRSDTNNVPAVRGDASINSALKASTPDHPEQILQRIVSKESIRTAHDGSILFGLQGTKSVGLAALENIIQERTKKPFKDLLDFCKRIDLRTSNKRVIENLICAGAFDTLLGSRAQKINELPHIIDIATEYKKNAATGQMGLFQRAKTADGQEESYAFQPCTPWTDKEKLEKEKEVIGFYLSAHPLDSYKKQLRRLACAPFEAILKNAQTINSMQEPVVIGYGLLKSRKDINTKKGDRMSFVQLEDASSTAEIILFPRTFKKVEHWLDEHQVFVVKGNFDLASQQKCKIKAQEFVPLELLLEEWPNIQGASLQLPNNIQEEIIETLAQRFKKGRVPLEFIFHENGKKIRLSTKNRIKVTQETIDEIEEHGIKVQLQL